MAEDSPKVYRRPAAAVGAARNQQVLTGQLINFQRQDAAELLANHAGNITGTLSARIHPTKVSLGTSKSDGK